MEEPEITMPEENKTGIAGFIRTRNGKIVLGVVVVVLLCTCCAVVVAGFLFIGGPVLPTQFDF